jgi:hypothetical protein
MKRFSFSLFFTLIAIAAIVGSAFAEGAALPGSGWYSGETIQNVGPDTANIDITAYDSVTTQTYNLTDTILSGASKSYLPNQFTGMPDGFQGSAIVSSSQDIRAIVNVTNRYLSTLGLGDSGAVSPAAGQYQGMNVPATSIAFPLVKCNYFSKTTSFFIQNAGSSAASVTGTFVIGGVTYTFNSPAAVGPGQMTVFTANDARNASNQPPTQGNSCIGSLTVTSTQPLAGTVLEHFTAETHATVLQATRGFTSNDYDTTIYVPTVKNNYFRRFTGLQVQNVSGGNVDVTVTYKTLGDANCTAATYNDQKLALAAGASHTFPSNVIPDDQCFASATVVATGNIVGVVNESYSPGIVPGTRPYQESTTYSAIASSAATTVVSVPVYKEDSFNKGTGLTIQNVGAVAATNVVLTFTGPTGTYVTSAQTIQPGAALNVNDARNKAPSFWNGTAMTPQALGCTTSGCGSNGLFGVIITADQPIVVISNESTYPFSAPRINQDKNNYEGFNLTTAP